MAKQDGKNPRDIHILG